MKRVAAALVVGVVAGLLALHAAPRRMIGVLQFDQINDIGVQDAALVIPELLVSDLQAIGVYDLSERILLSRVLEEQQLELSGIADERKAVAIGKQYGLEAIVTGTVMNVLGKTVISARLIDTETGEILRGHDVELRSTRELTSKVEELAYFLSGCTRQGYEQALFDRTMARPRLAVAAGAAVPLDVGGIIRQVGGNAIRYTNPSVGLSFVSRSLTVGLGLEGLLQPWFNAKVQAAFYPWRRVGLSLAYIAKQDTVAEVLYQAGALTPDQFEHSVGGLMQVLYAGIELRAAPEVTFSLLYGKTLAGHRTQYFRQGDARVKYAEYEYGLVVPEYFPNLNFVFRGEAYILRNVYVRVDFSVNGEDARPVNPGDIVNGWLSTGPAAGLGSLELLVGYAFTL